MITIQVNDHITPALQELERRLTNRCLILRLHNRDQHKLPSQNPTTAQPHRWRYFLVDGQLVPVGQRRLLTPTPPERYLLVGGVKYPYPARGSQRRLPPAVLHRARQATRDFVMAEIKAALRSS